MQHHFYSVIACFLPPMLLGTLSFMLSQMKLAGVSCTWVILNSLSLPSLLEGLLYSPQLCLKGLFVHNRLLYALTMQVLALLQIIGNRASTLILFQPITGSWWKQPENCELWWKEVPKTRTSREWVLNFLLSYIMLTYIVRYTGISLLP